jgi:tRNA(Met) cytidine acetyltransferase
VISRHRLLCVLQGERGFLLAQAASVLRSCGGSEVLYRTEGLMPAVSEFEHWKIVSTNKLRSFLGTEADAVVYDGFAGIDPDALGILSGTLRAGALMFVLVPSWNAAHFGVEYLTRFWPYLHEVKTAHNFLTRLLRVLSSDPDVLIFPALTGCTEVRAGSAEYRTEIRTEIMATEYRRLVSDNSCGNWRLTNDQAQALLLVEPVVNGHARRPLVLTADRGRGKSFLLGVASVHCQIDRRQVSQRQVVQQQVVQRQEKHGQEKHGQDNKRARRIILTASSRASVNVVFEAARRFATSEGLFDYERENAIGFNSGGSLRFCAIDSVLNELPVCDLLIVDEAASIPLFILERLLSQFNRILFSSTIAGYEGHGRGFSISFKKVLARHARQWKHFTLTEPVRWADNDPLERVVNKALLLDADFASELFIDERLAPAQVARNPFPTALQSSDIRCEPISKQQLLEDPDLLREAFGLLVFAHYQTSPADLIVLLDTPNTELIIARKYTAEGNFLLGVCLLCEEGGFSEELDQQVMRGERRVRGHLVPQSLSFHAGCEGVTRLRCLRVMRIATHPGYLRKGIANALINFSKALVQQRQLDYLTTSFSATPDVCAFWQHCGLSLLRVGRARDGSSGGYSLIMGLPLTDTATQFFSDCQIKLAWTMRYQLLTSYQDMLPEVVWFIFLGTVPQPLPSAERQCMDADLVRFCSGDRPLDAVSGSLHLWLWTIDRRLLQPLPADAALLLTRWLLQGGSVQNVCKTLNLPNEKALSKKLKAVIGSVPGGE